MTQNSDKTIFGAPDIAMIVTCFLWGIGAVVVKNAIGDTPETFRIFVFNGLRMPLVSLMLFAGVLLTGGSIGLKREHVPFIAVISFAGMFMHIVTSLIGLKLSSASNMGIVFATVPLFILIVSFVTRVERPSPRLVIGILIGLPGVLALSWQNGRISFNPGDTLFIASCVFWAVYTVYSKRILNSYAPVAALAWVFLFASLYQMPLFFFQLREQAWATVSAANWINLAIGTVGSYAIANSLYYYAIHKIGPVRVGIYNNLTPVFTVLLANLIRGESITAMKIAGLSVILFGIAVTKIPVGSLTRQAARNPLPPR